MSNLFGKTLLEAKKVGSAISKSAKEIGGAVGEATSNIAGHTKKTAKIAMLKAEMDQMYTKLGKAVFNYGMIEENEEALEIMKEMLDKKSEIERLEKELDDCNEQRECNHDHECGHDGPCDCECDCEDCDEDCDCGCHDEDGSQIPGQIRFDEDGTIADDNLEDCKEENEEPENKETIQEEDIL